MNMAEAYDRLNKAVQKHYDLQGPMSGAAGSPVDLDLYKAAAAIGRELHAIDLHGPRATVSARGPAQELPSAANEAEITRRIVASEDIPDAVKGEWDLNYDSDDYSGDDG